MPPARLDTPARLRARTHFCFANLEPCGHRPLPGGAVSMAAVSEGLALGKQLGLVSFHAAALPDC